MKITRRSFIAGGAAGLAAVSLAPVFSGCAPQKTKSGINPKDFETKGLKTLNSGLEKISSADVPTKLYTITNKAGMELCVTNVGARLVSLMVKNKNGEFVDVLLGYDNVKPYANFKDDPKNYYGAVVGRYANRIGKGQFSIDGKQYQTNINEKGNMLHGGDFGLHFQAWEEVEYDKNSHVKLMYKSPDGEMGFPGELTIFVKYSLDNENTLTAEYEAKTTASTPVNLSNHSYFCLAGDTDHPISQEHLYINSKKYTPTDANLIPTGEIADIEPDSVFDFYSKGQDGRVVGDQTASTNPDIKNGGGYDMNFIIDDKNQPVAVAHSDYSGITMEITSDQPALQFFDCHNLDGSVVGKGKKFNQFCAYVLETQHYPDSPNHANFPDTILKSGNTFKSKTNYKFSVKK